MHGKDLVDALAGIDKAFLRNGFIYGICSAQIDEDGKALSESEKCAKFLSNPDRQKGDTKHKTKLDGTDVKSRTYQTTDFDDKNKVQYRSKKAALT